MCALPPAGPVFGIDSGEYRGLPNSRQMTRRSKTDVQKEAGTIIIHVAACHPTSIGLAYDTLTQAVRRYPDRNGLIVAPGGNDRGAYWCISAVLSDVLMVGAMRDNGQPLQCSNWCGPYQTQEGLAPGEEVAG